MKRMWKDLWKKIMLSTSLAAVSAMAVSPMAYAADAGGARLASTSRVKISSKNFPDKALRNYLSYCDEDEDGYLSDDEIECITELELNGEEDSETEEITDLTGIDKLEYLNKLSIKGTGITELDVTGCENLDTLQLYDTHITNLDVTGCTSLTKMVLYYVDITDLDLTGCTNLESLNTTGLNIANLDISECTGLKSLYVASCNNITDAVVSGMKNLTDVTFSGCDELNSLEIKDDTALTEFRISDVPMNGKLDITGCSNLTTLSLYETHVEDSNLLNGLSKLECLSMVNVSMPDTMDVSENTALTSMRISADGTGNGLSYIDVSKNTELTYLNLSTNALTSIDVSKNTKLTELNVADNDLDSIDVSANTEMTVLNVSKNGFENDDVTGLPEDAELTSLDMSGNNLTGVDISANSKLTYANLSDNKLTNVDLSNNKKIEMFMCYNNKLTSLDVSDNSSLTYLNVEENALTALDLTGCDSDNGRYAVVDDQTYKTNYENTSDGCLVRMDDSFDSSKVSSVSVDNVEIASEGFLFDNDYEVPYTFTYSYDTGISCYDYKTNETDTLYMDVTVAVLNSASVEPREVAIEYENTSIYCTNPNPDSFIYGDGNEVTLQDAPKDGTTFSNWILDDGYGGYTEVTELTDEIVGDYLSNSRYAQIVLKAVYDPEVKEIIYNTYVDGNGNIQYYDDMNWDNQEYKCVEVGGTVALSEPTREGYTFDGWYREMEVYNGTQYYYMPLTELTDYSYYSDRTIFYIYAKWIDDSDSKATPTDAEKKDEQNGGTDKDAGAGSGKDSNTDSKQNGNAGSGTIITTTTTTTTTPAKKTALSAPKTAVKNTAKGVKVTWNKVKNASGYIVYRKVKGGTFKQIGKTSGASYTDKKAKAGKTYYYEVKAYKGSVVSGVKQSKAIKFLKAPASVKVAKKSNGIKVTWKKSTGAKGYVIYRKTGSGSWKKVKTVKGASTLTYLDKSAKKGKKYTYKVKATNGKSSSVTKTSKKIKR